MQFLNFIFRYYDLPDDILSDRGTKFTSKFWIDVYKGFNIILKFSFSFHHQTNSLTERVKSAIEKYLRCYTNLKGSNWVYFLYLAEFSYDNGIYKNLPITRLFSQIMVSYGFIPKH